MADIGTPQNDLVGANHEVKMKWIAVQIQERKSRIARHKQDIEDLKKGKIVELEAKIMMLERELKKLQEDINVVKPIEA